MVLLSPRELAAALGVSESSLKRWIDAGKIRASRTEGGHRRITLADARAFIRETGTPVLRPELLGLQTEAAIEQDNRPTRTTGANAFQRALVSGDFAATRAWVRDSKLSLADLCDGPIRNAMHAIGELWRHDPDGVFIEHRATDLCMQAIVGLRTATAPPSRAPVAVGCAPEDDPYLLPTAMAALVLAGEGYRAVNLGADTPIGALERAVAHHRPRLVWVSASSPLPIAQAHELAACLGDLPHAPTVIVGGRQRESILAANPALRSGRTMTDLVELARSLR